MIIFEKKYIEKKEYLDGLKTVIEEAKNSTIIPKMAIFMQAKEIFCSMTDEEKAKFESENGVGISDLLLFCYSNQFTFELKVPLEMAMLYIDLANLSKLTDIEEIISILNKPLLDIPDWEYVFRSLTMLPNHLRRFYIAQIECNNNYKSDLSESLKNNDFNCFINTVSTMGKDVYILNNVADLYTYIFKGNFVVGEIITAFQKGYVSSFKEMQEIMKPAWIEKDQYEQMMNDSGLDAFKSLCTADFNSDSTATLPNMLKLDNLKKYYGNLMGRYLLLRDNYLENTDKYSKEEQDLIRDLIKDPDKIDFYRELINRGYTFRIIDDTEDNFHNFDKISIFENNPNKNKSEYFNGLAGSIVNGGDEKFKELVNYIANEGYINNTDAAKQLFTYRLTGRCRPEGGLEPLIWDGREKMSANELIYIIRYATDESKSKYKRMEEFFTGPTFPQKDRSGWADQARKDFRDFLNSLYPDVFKIKDISQY